MAFSYHAGHPFHPNLLENTLISDKVFSEIAHDYVKSLSLKGIETVVVVGSHDVNFPVI